MIIPCKLRAGDTLLVLGPDDQEYRAVFISHSSTDKAVTLHSNDWGHLPEADHLGFVRLDDETVIRRARLVPHEEEKGRV
ncbi:hypothetical protein [Alloalcanivorax xenomutans]